MLTLSQTLKHHTPAKCTAVDDTDEPLAIAENQILRNCPLVVGAEFICKIGISLQVPEEL